MNNREVLFGYIRGAETEAEMRMILVSIRLVKLETAVAHFRALEPLGPLLGIEDVVEAARQRMLITFDELRTEAIEALDA